MVCSFQRARRIRPVLSDARDAQDDAQEAMAREVLRSFEEDFVGTPVPAEFWQSETAVAKAGLMDSFLPNSAVLHVVDNRIALLLPCKARHLSRDAQVHQVACSLCLVRSFASSECLGKSSQITGMVTFVLLLQWH